MKFRMQINFCTSQQVYFQHAKYVKEIIKERFPLVQIEQYGIGGTSGEFMIYIMDLQG